jgi:hypothetical protein
MVAGVERSSAIHVKWHGGGCRESQSFALRQPPVTTTLEIFKVAVPLLINVTV